MDRPMALCNRSISNSCSDDSSQCFSVSTLGSKLSNADSSYYIKKKITLKSDPSQYKTPSSSNKYKKKKMRRKSDLRDRLALSVHASDSDLKQARRAARAGLDRQLSISRWMADTVNDHCGNIRRTVSSHETLELPVQELQESRQQHPTMPELVHNTPFKLFHPAQSQKSLNKPVRKRSQGPEGLLGDVLRALSGHERKVIDDKDIEEDTDDDVEFHSDYEEEDLNSTLPLPDTDICNTPNAQEPLLEEQSSRWDASSPSREVKKDVPPLDRLVRGLSSRKMPVPPPPPFSPANSTSKLGSVVPHDLFQSNSNTSEGGSTPSKPLRYQLQESLNKGNINHTVPSLVPPLAPSPLAATSAAIAIATASMEESEEECELNDLVTRRRKGRSVSTGNSFNDYKTDAATADSIVSIDDQDSWNECSDEEISVDVSMLSASNTTFTSLTATTHQSNNKSLNAVGSSGLAAYMNREEGKESKVTKPTGLGSYMNWIKQQKEEKEQVNEEVDYKSFADDTFDTFGTFATLATDGSGSPTTRQKNTIPLPLKSCSDHHPVLNLSRRDPSIVPPSMPKRSVSNHEKIDTSPRTPKSKSAMQKQLNKVKSPTGDRVQRLLDANKRKCRYNKCKAPGNFDPGTPTCQQQRFSRRVSLDHTTNSSPTPMARRRASLDMSILSSGRHPPLLTPTITKTPRISPSMRNSRKRLNNNEHGIPDLQSPQKTPVATRNLSSFLQNGRHLVE